jgi:hypothetical protein
VGSFGLSPLKFVQEKIEEKGKLFLATYLEMKNASLIFLSEREDRFGTLAVAMPPSEKMLGPALSSNLLGDRNVMVARLLAERIAQKSNKLALVSVSVETLSEMEAGPILLRLVEKTMRKE